nr:phage head morphogenesis protein, SPP1 gp7 family (phageSPP1_gp7) [uncultured Mediterranean phage uvMED]
MGGEDQLKGLIRQGFALQNTADKAQGLATGTLARSMSNIKRLVEILPQEGLLRNKAWRDLEPLVRKELEVYADALGQAIVKQDSDAASEMRDASVREFERAGAELPEAVRTRRQPVANSVELALKSKVNNVTVEKLFNINKKDGASPVSKALFRTVDTRVRAGIINGDTTQDIADLMATDVMARGIPGVKLTAPVAKQIQSQARAMARTATQDMARQVKEQLYEQNREALEGMVWQWSTALDSRTCETCAPLDGRRWDENDNSRPDWPLHPNCRCQALLIDPEDEFWNGGEATAQQIRPVEQGAYAGPNAYKTPITINGEKFYRKTITVTSDTGPPRYSDVLARWAKDGSTSLNEALGPARAAWFKKQYDRMNADPQRILQAMLTQKPPGEQTWIPLVELEKKSLKFKSKNGP